jgi:hypothetical protein
MRTESFGDVNSRCGFISAINPEVDAVFQVDDNRAPFSLPAKIGPVEIAGTGMCVITQSCGFVCSKYQPPRGKRSSALESEGSFDAFAVEACSQPLPSRARPGFRAGLGSRLRIGGKLGQSDRECSIRVSNGLSETSEGWFVFPVIGVDVEPGGGRTE